MSELHTPNSRVYVHLSCGNSTVVSDEHFTMICNPFRLVSGTFCVGCNNFFPLTQFVWADTGEVIAEARKRWAEEAPPGVKKLTAPLGCLLALALGAAIGGVIAWLAGVGEGWKIGVGAAVGGIGLGIVWSGIVVPHLLSSLYDWDPRRLK